MTRPRSAAFWLIAVPLALAFAFSMMGAGYLTCEHVRYFLGGTP